MWFDCTQCAIWQIQIWSEHHTYLCLFDDNCTDGRNPFNIIALMVTCLSSQWSRICYTGGSNSEDKRDWYYLPAYCSNARVANGTVGSVTAINSSSTSQSMTGNHWVEWYTHILLYLCYKQPYKYIREHSNTPCLAVTSNNTKYIKEQINSPSLAFNLFMDILVKQPYKIYQET